MPFSSLRKGFLTGAINENTKFDAKDFRNIVPRFTPEARKANQARVTLLAEIASHTKATPPKSRWRLSRKPWIVPIPGTTKLHRLTLAGDDFLAIEDALSNIAVEVGRYPPHLAGRAGC